MKKYSTAVLKKWLKNWEPSYKVLAPIALLDETRSLGELTTDAELKLSGGALPMKPARAFTPYVDLLFSFSRDGKIIQKPAELPLLVVGFTAQDLDCLEFVDKFFSTHYYDEYYFAKRKNAAVIGISGKCGNNGELLKVAGGKCDIELIGIDNENNGNNNNTGETQYSYVVVAYSELGQKLSATLDAAANNASDKGDARDLTAAEIAELQQMKADSQNIDKEDKELLQKASTLLLTNKVPDTFWEDIANRCINCTACTFCPTCTCFDVFDRHTTNDKDQTERWRSFDSCLLASFMREASGHNPMGAESSRTRRRIHHRLAADVMRWGCITCYLCGRCDEVCPSDIGIKSVCREMVAKYDAA